MKVMRMAEQLFEVSGADIDAIKANLTDEVFRQFSEEYGQRVSGVKLGGYWIIYVGEPGHKKIVSGDTLQGQRRRRHLSHALSDGLNVTIHLR
jgi:hypothetical protein